jgi:hypothetical protein
MHMTQSNLVKAAQGRETKFGIDAVKFIRGLTPGGNLWYAKAALDHLIVHRLQEYFAPGYLSREQTRLYREYGGQTYYWQPGAGPDQINAPRVERVLGQ